MLNFRFRLTIIFTIILIFYASGLGELRSGTLKAKELKSYINHSIPAKFNIIAGEESLSYPVSFTFNLKRAAVTSAGVFKKDGVLIKTLWSGVPYKAGRHKNTWDGTDDEGRLAPSAKYDIRVLSNNVRYTWEGVIGNNSSQISGSTVHRGNNSIHGIAVSGKFAYYCTNYNEGDASQFKFKLSNPQERLRVFPPGEGTGQATRFVVTDDKNVYWAGNDPFSPNSAKWFVFGTKVKDDSETVFERGTALKAKYGRTYISTIDFINDNKAAISGLAVQKTGKYLFVSHKELNALHVLNKTTGALVKSIHIMSPSLLAVDKSNNLWVSYLANGKPILQKFAVRSDGTIKASSNRITNLHEPLGMAVSPNGFTIMVADGGKSQQLKAYSNTSAALSWTLGRLGGYAKNSTVFNDKFYFSNPSKRISNSFITFQPDGTFWVGDAGNFRALHFSPNRRFITSIMYLPSFYSSFVDPSNPTRVFADYLEFKIDYSKRLGSNNRSWKLIKNWGYNVPENYDDKYHRLRSVVTLINNRTYAILRNHAKNTWALVELPYNGPLRITGIEFNDNFRLYPDGSLRKVSTKKLSSPTIWEKKKLLGFDRSNNPIWDAERVLASSPPATRKDPLYAGALEITNQPGEITSSNVLVSFDGGLPPRGSEGWHLGGIRLGDNKWLWRTALGTKTDYAGPYPTDGTYDTGNGVQYGGSVALTLDRNIFWGYHGEFWKGSQVNKWTQVYDDGLFIGQFGVTGPEVKNFEAAPMMAGNSFSGSLVKVSKERVYLYHNDESYHGGVHRWKVDELNTIQEQTIPVELPFTNHGLLAQYFSGIDLNNFNIKSIRIDPSINFNWNDKVVGTSLLNSENFSVIWSGYVEPRYTETYNFYTNTDDGVRLWVDGNLLINHWQDGAAKEYKASATLVAGKRYSIRLEYYQKS